MQKLTSLLFNQIHPCVFVPVLPSRIVAFYNNYIFIFIFLYYIYYILIYHYYNLIYYIFIFISIIYLFIDIYIKIIYIWYLYHFLSPDNHISFARLVLSPCDKCSCTWASWMLESCTNYLFEWGLLARPWEILTQLYSFHNCTEASRSTWHIFLLSGCPLRRMFQSLSDSSVADSWLQSSCWLLLPCFLSTDEFEHFLVLFIRWPH